MSDFASANLTAGQLNALVKKVGGENEALRVLRGELVIKLVRRIWTIWATVKLGTEGCETGVGLRGAMKAKGVEIGAYANAILGNREFPCSKKEKEIDLVVVPLDEMGFDEPVNLAGIYARATELGLEPCPIEAGPCIVLQHPDKMMPAGGHLPVCHKPVTYNGGVIRVFNVGRTDNGRPELTCFKEDPTDLWRLGEGICFIFVKPRK